MCKVFLLSSLLSEDAQSPQQNRLEGIIEHVISSTQQYKLEERNPGTKLRGQEILGAFVSWIRQ